MKRESFNRDWGVRSRSTQTVSSLLHQSSEHEKKVDMPYDAMIHETRTPETKNANQTGFYPGGDYCYTKRFLAQDSWAQKDVYLEFEGVYGNTTVFVNDIFVRTHVSGYSSFAVKLNDYLIYGEENVVKLDVLNSNEPNSRWYSGSGIYRDVHLIVADRLHFMLNGVRISTPDVEKDGSIIRLEANIENRHPVTKTVNVVSRILDANREVASVTTRLTLFANSKEKVFHNIYLHHAKLWSPNEPNLYTAELSLMCEGCPVDQFSDDFGIRKLQLDPCNGLRINGEVTKLRGACIHHDNGILGANAFYEAEERKIRKLKEGGFNCIRSAHNHVGRATLYACDRLGMLVMDELSDFWTKGKNDGDTSRMFADYWQEDVESMVADDFNHPSVIMYSTGNEIPEAGNAHGARMNRQIANYCRELDSTRYLTAGANAMLALGDKMGAVMKDILAKMTGKTAKELGASKARRGKSDGAGSNDLNSAMSSIMMGPMADAFATHPMTSACLDEFVDALDIAGYNYLTGRHEKEHANYPNRVVLGTETFPCDIARLWSIVENNSHVIGDMTWTGYDYLGEAGIGLFYYDDRKPFSKHFPDRVAGCGDIDIIGNRKPLSYLRQIVFGLRKDPYIAVERVDRNGQKPNQSTWAWKDVVSSWNWEGHEECPAKIYVMSAGDETELFLNGRSLGRKQVGQAGAFLVEYETTYLPGELRAVSYEHGKIIGEHILKTAGTVTGFSVDADDPVPVNTQGLTFIEIALVDDAGIVNPNSDREIFVQVDGPGELLAVGSANPQSVGGYDVDHAYSYEGRILAVIRSASGEGEIKVTLSAKGCMESNIVINTK